MIRFCIFLSCVLLSCSLSQTQETDYVDTIKKWQQEHDELFSDPDKSPLKGEDLVSFSGHDFYPINESYRVKARFEPTPDSRPFQLGTSKGTTKIYKRIGVLHFDLKGESFTLEAYVEQKRFSLPGQPTYVFLPLVDETTGNETYGAGRYMHYEGIPEGTEWVIDFNKLYNPLCAYDEKYECPKVPEPNYLSIKIEAGIKGY